MVCGSIREAMLRGGERGPAVVPGQPDKSLLIEAVRQSGDLQMPPDAKLADKQISIFEHWIEIGATPGQLTLFQLSISARMQRTHWAFQPVRKPTIPTVKDATWATNPLDAFILAELESRGLKLAPPADRRT